MSAEFTYFTPKLHTYLRNVSLREPEILKALREETHHLSNHIMQISPEQGQFMALLVELIGAKKTLDIGTFTGYSALAVALALPKDGKVIACDVSEEWTRVARTFWEKAGVAHKIELKLAPALDTLQHLLDTGFANQFDFAFIDADKTNYPEYYEKSLKLVKEGGIIAIDNVLWDGKVADEKNHEKSTQIIRTLNENIKRDERVSISMLPIGDGLTLARKRSQ